MSTIDEIKQAIERLTPEELRAFRAWLAEYDGAQWDREIEVDVVAGRLDALADRALQDRCQGPRSND